MDRLHKVDKHVTKSTKWTDHPKGEITYKVHKVDGSLKG